MIITCISSNKVERLTLPKHTKLHYVYLKLCSIFQFTDFIFVVNGQIVPTNSQMNVEQISNNSTDCKLYCIRIAKSRQIEKQNEQFNVQVQEIIEKHRLHAEQQRQMDKYNSTFSKLCFEETNADFGLFE
ncbi:Hypothetical_protein [Hexamita inflata]|uniref:Hypothetical_protein n=1 Tax=Hexamita inflata TaxID=28002 RepID=A0AA86NZH7_9EUKA|nr:Hypothetical protein HINF_LOCUS16564 [Hexamita inflata]